MPRHEIEVRNAKTLLDADQTLYSVFDSEDRFIMTAGWRVIEGAFEFQRPAILRMIDEVTREGVCQLHMNGKGPRWAVTLTKFVVVTKASEPDAGAL